MEVVITSRNSHFDFRMPHATAPSSPKRLGEYYLSAPTSPSRLSQFYRDLDDLFADGSGGGGSAAAVPFEWEEKPGTPKSPPAKGGGDDFAFDVSEDWETASLPADELFDGGMIKPLKPPPRLQFSAAARVSEDPAASPRRRRSTRKTYDPFAVAAKKAAWAAAPLERGRERGVIVSKSSSRRAARSLSPLRDGQYQWEEVKEHSQNAKHGSAATPSAVTSALSTAVKGSKKWRLKDFFLFRSASEGRADERDPLKKYTAAWRRSSFQYVEGPGSGSGSKRRGPVSAHELHYTMNRAVSEDLKKKTFLPYRQGILGRLAFNPAVHALANGFGFSRKS